VGRYVSEAWFGRQLDRHPPANRRVRNVPARPLTGPAPLLRHGHPEPARQTRPQLARPAGIALIVTGSVLLLAVSIPLPFLHVKLLGLIIIVAGLVKVGAPQRVSRWLSRNRRVGNMPAPPLAAPAPLVRHGQPEPARQALARPTGPAGMALVISGSVLLLAVSIPLPFLHVKLLGLIIIVAGLVKARVPQRVSSWLWRNRRVRNGQARPGLTRPAGMGLIVTGTVLLLAVSIPLPLLHVKLLGLIIIVAGLVKARAPQRMSSWLWRNRRVVMTARAPLDTLPGASAPVAPPAERHAARAQRRRPPGALGGQSLERLERRRRRAGADQLAGRRLTVTVIVPAYNEEDGIRDTLDALMRQTNRPERIIVVDDCSKDNTGPVAREYDVEVLRPPHNLGSKAKAQNYALPHCATDLVLPVDADTILAADYVERIKRPFEDPRVVIAAGNVQTKVTRSVTERGRSIEYLYGFHFYRPIQNRAGAPVVCSGCCSAFRREVLVASGGFPERTIVEDFDWTATQQIAGNKAVYVAGAEAWAADPETIRYLRKQMNRWMSGFFQNMRIHFWPAWRHKPVLAFWYSLAIAEILMLPFWWGSPLLWVYVWHDPLLRTLAWWLIVQLIINIPVLMYAAVRRRVNPLSVLVNFPLVYVNGAVNSFYAWKGMIVELVLVPLGIAQGLMVYEKGR
jgi:N-acetylglucosaminyltransferase